MNGRGDSDSPERKGKPKRWYVRRRYKVECKKAGVHERERERERERGGGRERTVHMHGVVRASMLPVIYLRLSAAI
jgi:hypothetical protein